MKIFEQTKDLGMVDVSKRYLRLRTVAIVSTIFLISIIGGSFTSPYLDLPHRDTVLLASTSDTVYILLRNKDMSEIVVPRNANIPTFCNNPGSLRPSGIPEVNELAIAYVHAPSGKFLYFANPEHGYQALEIVLRKVYWNSTIEEMMVNYAPDFENNTSKYTKDLSLGANVTPKTKVKNCDLKKLMKMIAKIEGFKSNSSKL